MGHTKNVKLIKRNCKRALTKERRGGEGRRNCIQPVWKAFRCLKISRRCSEVIIYLRIFWVEHWYRVLKRLLANAITVFISNPPPPRFPTPSRLSSSMVIAFFSLNTILSINTRRHVFTSNACLELLAWMFARVYVIATRVAWGARR